MSPKYVSFHRIVAKYSKTNVAGILHIILTGFDKNFFSLLYIFSKYSLAYIFFFYFWILQFYRNHINFFGFLFRIILRIYIIIIELIDKMWS